VGGSEDASICAVQGCSRGKLLGQVRDSELTHKLEFEALTAKEGWRKRDSLKICFWSAIVLGHTYSKT
jgi:hypothetical protein